MRRDLDGVLPMDKYPGITSAGLVAKVKRSLGVKKAGHAGTLDPFASGLMILCLGKATRLARFFLHGVKTYEGLLRLGIETDTQDRDGKVVATREVNDFSMEQIHRAFAGFKGAIKQVPPVYSALKHKGAPLYKLARQGKPVQKPARDAHIYRLDILDILLPEIRFRVTCSGGVYIRTLAADIGGELGCGAHLKELRRTECRGFKVREALSLETLERWVDSGAPISDDLSGTLIPMAAALNHLPEYTARGPMAGKIANGVMLEAVDIAQMGEPKEPSAQTIEIERGPEEYFKIVDENGELLAVISRDKIQNNYKYCCVFPA